MPVHAVLFGAMLRAIGRRAGMPWPGRRRRTVVIASESNPAPPASFACGEVRGGNGTIHTQVALPGLRGVLYSRPCAGATGGDIHYLSVCGSGLLARVCLADVAGHGTAVSAVGAEMHAHLRRSVDVIDERKVLDRLNRRLNKKGAAVMTTAVLATYYPPRRRLTVSSAGHPAGWLFRADTGAWAPLSAPAPAPRQPGFADLPLGIGFTPAYSRHRVRVSPGDRMLLFTDGVLETISPDDTPFDTRGLETVLNGETRQLRRHCASSAGGPPRPCGVRRTGTRRRDVSARGVRRRSARARLVARVQASCSGTGAAVRRWRVHHPHTGILPMVSTRAAVSHAALIWSTTRSTKSDGSPRCSWQLLAFGR